MKKFNVARIIAGAVVSTCFVARLTSAEPALTIYNQNFAVVRDTVALNLQRGVNQVRVSEVTSGLEPESVVLRDPSGKRSLQILEQNYRADPITQQRLLALYEGKTIDFLVPTATGNPETIRGKIIRSGYVPPVPGASPYSGYDSGGVGQPLVEVDGKLRFQLPGTPLFPDLGDDTILKPILQWTLQSEQPGPLQAELAYITRGMWWQADYNIVAPENGDLLDLVAWVTLSNRSGKTFDNARIKLMAGDVSKIQRPNPYDQLASRSTFGSAAAFDIRRPPVTEKAFDEYHLYSLTRPSTLRDGETKQVEFARAQRVKSQRLYIYDGLYVDPARYCSWSFENIRNEPEYGTQSNPKVWVMREFVNTTANGLGIPLPQGRMRFYRRDADGQVEFTGENLIDHTPQGETVRINTGNAFDMVGERKRIGYKIDKNGRWINEETFEITLRNRKKEAVEVRVVEHLYRWMNWEIIAKSSELRKTDAQTIEFRVPLQPNEEKVITYTVRYTWS
jgi:hypothetical protein